jgi:hypothetical protein
MKDTDEPRASRNFEGLHTLKQGGIVIHEQHTAFFLSVFHIVIIDGNGVIRLVKDKY